jgi:hypothetical protein
LEGYWPDQSGYDIIHKHQLYLNATKAEEKVWKGMKNNMYDRFILVK